MGEHDGLKCCPCAEALANEFACAEQALRNLVAVIDRDGGHAQRGESVTASGERAEAVVIGERVATDTTTAVQRQRVKDMSACVTTLENELSALRAQRDEARELVRRYVEGDCLYDELNEERACNAVLRWDEEAKR